MTENCIANLRHDYHTRRVVANVFPRLLAVPDRSFFLFGPRATGKSTWLRSVLPAARRLDLLDTRLALELTREPHRLESHLGDVAGRDWVTTACGSRSAAPLPGS